MIESAFRVKERRRWGAESYGGEPPSMVHNQFTKTIGVTGL